MLKDGAAGKAPRKERAPVLSGWRGTSSTRGGVRPARRHRKRVGGGVENME